MADPKVSVIMAVHNEEDFLAEAIESVLEQDHRNLELIVSDDGSTDQTLTIARGYERRDPARVTVLTDERNQGKATAANRALEVAEGELIAWLDGDDVMLPGKLSKQVALLADSPDAVGCCHDAEIFNSESGRIEGRFSAIANGRPLREGGVELWFDPTYRMLPSATMFRSSACPPGGLDSRLLKANDWLFDIELFRQGRCIASNEVLVRYRRHGGQMTDPADRSKWFEESLIVMSIVTARYPELQRSARTSTAALLLGEARRLARAGERGAAALRAWGALRSAGVMGLLQVAGYVAGASWGRLRSERRRPR